MKDEAERLEAVAKARYAAENPHATAVAWDTLPETVREYYRVPSRVFLAMLDAARRFPTGPVAG